MSTSAAAIETTSLSRVYQTYVKPAGVWSSVRGFFHRQHLTKTALHPLSLTIEQGRIVGLVGANGAGKTTLLKMLSGLIYPSAGDARVLGFTPWKRERAFLKQISILLGQKNQLWWDIPPADSYELLIRIYDLDPYDARQRIKHLSELLECSDLLNIQLRRLSLGERMKMEIIASLLHRPRVLFLDEPTIGLDVVAQKSIRSFLSEYVRTEGPTVLLTSHYMDDIATLADRLLLISGGTLQYDGTVKHFMSATEAKQRLTVNLTGPLPESVHLTPEIVFEGGKEVFTADLKVSEVPRAIAELTSRVAAREIRLEEADFEDVIRQFLESESRVLSARNR